MNEESKSIKYEVNFNKLIYENKMCSVYEARALHFGDNANGMEIPRSAVEEALPLFYNLPMYGIMNNKKTDFEEHYRGKNDERHSEDDIRVFGVIPESSKVELIEEDGKTFIVFEVVVWKALLPYITKILMARDFSIKLSIEFLITKYHIRDDKYVVVEKFVPQAITALGKNIPEGIKGSSLKLLRFSEQSISDKCNEFYASYNSQKKFFLSEKILSNMKEGLSLREKHNRGGNKRAIELASNVVQYGFIFEDDLNYVKSYFSSNQYQPLGEVVTNKQILHKLYGGEEILSVTNSGDADSIKNFKEGGQKMDDNNVANSEEGVETPSTEPNAGEKGNLENQPNLNAVEPKKEPEEDETVTRHDDDVPKVDPSANSAPEVGKEEKPAVQETQQEKPNEPAQNPVVSESAKEPDPAQAGCSEDQAAKLEELTQKLSQSDAIILELQTKNSDLEAKCKQAIDSYNSVSSQLKEYQRKEEIAESLTLVEKFAHCFDEKSKEEIIALCSSDSYETVETKVQKKVMEFAAAKKTEDPAQNQGCFGGNPYFDPNSPHKEAAAQTEQYYAKSRCKVK